ncbi:MAG: winged helix-turn-helix domain-containing protein [Stellaceae bacterium]
MLMIAASSNRGRCAGYVILPSVPLVSVGRDRFGRREPARQIVAPARLRSPEAAPKKFRKMIRGRATVDAMKNLALGPFRLDAQNDLLLRGAEPIPLGKRAILLLRALIERPGEMVSKDALIEAGWPGLAVEESNLTVQISALRRALGEAPGGDRWIETMPRRGYRFVGPVAVEASKGAAERRLAAILAADVAGYSRLMGADEEGTLTALRAIGRELLAPKIAEHRGRIVKTTGDGYLVEFASVVDTVRCAIAVQSAMAERNTDIPSEQRIEFRIGIHQGDIIVEDGDIFGDGVNVAARLEGLAEPGSICVSARVQEDTAGKLDLEFEDLGEQSLKNIARAVRVYRMRSSDPNSPRQPAEKPHSGSMGANAAPMLALHDQPSIAVLPFANMSGDPDQEYFVDGMVEEIITALSQIRWLFVVARNSSFTYKGQHVDIKQVGRELGVRYVLEGSVRKAGSRVRIAGQLIDAATSTHLWADRFDGQLQDVFDMQDQVASSVAGVIEPALQAAEVARSAGRSTTDLTAYDLYLRGYAMVMSRSGQTPEALRLVEQAIARDPGYGPSLAWGAFCCARLMIDGESKDPQGDRLKGVDFARRALKVAGDDPAIIANAAEALAYFGEDIGTMMTLVDRALTLNPSFARGWHVSANIRFWGGYPDTAIEHAERALRLSPRARVGNTFYRVGVSHFVSRRFDEALPKLLIAIEEDPSFLNPRRFLAACYAHMGRFDEARKVVAELRTMTPVVIPDISYLRDPKHRDLVLSGLRLAAGEDAGPSRVDSK